MCDYSLQNVRSRPAKVGDKLTTRDFGTGTRGFAAAEDATTPKRSEALPDASAGPSQALPPEPRQANSAKAGPTKPILLDHSRAVVGALAPSAAQRLADDGGAHSQLQVGCGT